MNILVIDHDIQTYEMASKSPLVENCEAIDSISISEIVNFIREYHTDVVILGIDQSQSHIPELLPEIKKSDSRVEVIITGKDLPREYIMDLIGHGAKDYMSKPLDEEFLHGIFEEILKRMTLRRETFRLEKRLEKKYFFQGIIGKSPYMLEIFSLIEKISKYFTSVLITGETGTGKEMIASAIHSVCHTKNRKLVICDCVSIPDNLFESELFGYHKGAFTGADKDKKGLFDEAHEGIIFLDEIGEIPLPIQAKLLRILENHQFRPLGSNQVKKINVRVIAATNRNLKDCIKEGTFREDLYHRLNKVEIRLPALRDKPEDIPILVRYFLDGFNKSFQKDVKGISRQVQKLFLKYDWPGNIRELENVLERAIMLCNKDFIDIEDLPKDLQSTFTSKSRIPFINQESLSTLEDLEKEYIAYVLKMNNHNMRKVAKILNISRTTLYNKLEKYKIPRKE